ncbi:MAG: PLP-dependent aminotransferase family protein [Veillonellaceae bacterium]|nr:PLP-dependent aminotransferase family protein [Veillonellaceae bacterium]
MRTAPVYDILKPSDIGLLLKLTARPEVISFAGGLPAAETFPVAELTEMQAEVMRTDGVAALQYGPSRGHAPLREAIAAIVGSHGKTPRADDILVTNGSQQGLDLVARMFLEPGATVAMESPSYLGAIQAFALQMPKFREIATDEEGMIPEALEEALRTDDSIRFIYVIPDFQNPTGICWSLARRQALLEIAARYDVPVVEDSPYGDLRYEGEHLPSLWELDTEGNVIYLGTFSKTLSPGMRLGWLLARTEIVNAADNLRQSMDLAPSSLTQRIAALYLQRCDFAAQVARNVAVYRERRDTMLAAMEEFFPAAVHFTHPQGGLFTWATLPEGTSARAAFERALQADVAFVPGDGFFPNSKQDRFMRLNFSAVDPSRIREGIARLADILK